MTTTLNIDTYRRDGNVVSDAYRFAVHQAGVSRVGKYEAGYSINSDPPEVFTPAGELELAIQALLSEVRRHEGSLRHVEINWKHTTKDGNTVYPTVTFTG
jgi:hypothetical protein